MTAIRSLTPRRAAKALGLLALGLALAFAVSACGSSSASSGSTTSAAPTGTTGSSSSGAKSLSAFRSCLTQHGFTPSQGGPGGGGGVGGGTGAPGGNRPNLTPAQQQALSACASLRPAGGFGGRGGGQGGGNSAAFAALQACLKQHGVQPGSAGQTSSAKAQSAIAACRKQLPNGGSGAATPNGSRS